MLPKNTTGLTELIATHQNRYSMTQ